MKHLHQFKSRFHVTLALFILASLLFPGSVRAVQLSGTYTIDTSIAASATNFRNYASVITYLTTGARSDGGPTTSSPFGVSGPVVFQVAAGTFTERLIITSMITGASATNTITFDGGNGNAATRILTFNSTTAAAEPLVQLSGTRYFNFRNLTLKSTGTRGRGVNMLGTTGMITVKRCIIDLSGGASSASQNYRGIMIDTQVDSVQIDSNELSSGYYGIYMTGGSGSSINASIKIRNNTLKNIYGSGIQVVSVFNPVEILYNNVSMRPTFATSAGIVLDNCSHDLTTSHLILGNKVLNAAKGFRVINNLMYAFNPVKIYNNTVAYSNSFSPSASIYSGYGFEITTAVVEFYHNTVYMNIGGSSSISSIYGIYFDGRDSSIFKNNIFVCGGSHTASILQSCAAYFNVNPLGNSVNYNIYYNMLGTGTPTTNTLVYRNSTSYTSSNYHTAVAGGDSSFNLMPTWTAVDDLHFTGPCGLSKGLDLTSIIPADIDGETRNVPPHIGSDEYPGLPDNLAVTELLYPVSPVVSGPQDLRVRVKNVGGNTITSFAISYELNSGSPVTQFITATLGVCDTISVLFTGSNQPNIASGINNLKIYSFAPNSTSDANPSNDTIRATVVTALSGTFTIGPVGADFTSFTQAANTLVSGGMNGPVTFNVMTATYNEQISIPPVFGASAGNRIVFQSLANHRDSVVLNFNATAGNNYVVRLDRAAYITFRNMTIRALNATNGRVVAIMDTATFDTIDNCKLITASASSSSDATAVVYGFVKGRNNLVIKNNLIQNGGYGIYMGQPNTSFDIKGTITIEGNTMQNINYQNYFRALSRLKFRNNSVITTSTNTSYRGLYFIYGANDNDSLDITGNIFRQPGGDAIYLENPDYNKYGIIANNSVAITGPHNGSVNGIFASGLCKTKIYHNSVNINSSTTGGNAASFEFTSAGTSDIKNNVFSNSNGGVALIINTPSYCTSDNNNLYSTGTVVRTGTSTNYATLGAWRAASAKDMNSVSYRPGFTNVTTGVLTPNAADTASWSLNGRGAFLDTVVNAVIVHDINNISRSNLRSTGLPDIGAYEFTPTALSPLAVPFPASINPGDTQAFFYMGDTIAKVYGVSIAGPGVGVRPYLGEKPPVIGDVPYYSFYRVDIDNPYSATFDIAYTYKNQWLGTLPVESDMRLAKRSVASPSWAIDFSGVIDTVQNIMRAPTLYETYYSLTGSDLNTPLPVKLIAFTGNKIENKIVLSWATAAEKNSDRFEVQRSDAAGEWTPVGKVKAAGNSTFTQNYSYTDATSFNSNSMPATLYYRLKMIDQDGSYEYSPVVTIKPADVAKPVSVSVYPNPFAGHLNVKFETAGNTDSHIKVMDLSGRELFSRTVGASGMVKLEETADLQPGVYFISIETNGQQQVLKLLKQ